MSSGGGERTLLPNVGAATGTRRQPAQKAHLDFNTGWAPEPEYDMSWAVTEPAVYYQAAYVKLLSKSVD